MTACEDDSPEPTPDPARTFKVHIGEGNIVEVDTDALDCYPVKDWMVKEQIDYANLVYGNYFSIPGQTGVRFTAATHAPDGTPLETPGIVYEKEAVEIDYNNPELDGKYVWDNEYALNVWVCPIKNTGEFDTEYSAAGLSDSRPGRKGNARGAFFIEDTALRQEVCQVSASPAGSLSERNR